MLDPQLLTITPLQRRVRRLEIAVALLVTINMCLLFSGQVSGPKLQNKEILLHDPETGGRMLLSGSGLLFTQGTAFAHVGADGMSLGNKESEKNKAHYGFDELRFEDRQGHKTVAAAAGLSSWDADSNTGKIYAGGMMGYRYRNGGPGTGPYAYRHRMDQTGFQIKMATLPSITVLEEGEVNILMNPSAP